MSRKPLHMERRHFAFIANVIEFPDRPRPIYVALDFHDGFSIVAADDVTGDPQGVVIPLPKARP